jgi:hypothetical protein
MGKLVIVLLCIRVLENHIFLEPEIERLITAHDVLNRRMAIARFFQWPCAKQVLNKDSSTRVIESQK